MKRHSIPCRASRRGFSLVELLTVIFIIALLIGILLPALGAVRSSGRQASTQALLAGLNQAAGQFELDNRRQPGYFDANLLGSSQNFQGNNGQGLTYMENALLDLAGNDAISVDQPADVNGWIRVSPTGNADDEIWIKPDLIGASENAYFLPSAENLTSFAPNQQPGVISGQQVGQVNGIPDLIDSFGQPVLAWIENNNGPRNIRSFQDFASLDTETNRAAFYWTANASMLASSQLGEQGQSMTTTPSAGQVGSLIGQGALNAGNADGISGVMNALLGHPGYPDEALLAANDYATMHPTRARGSFIAHSAGADGIFLGAADNRLSRVVPSDAVSGGSFNITYGINFFNTSMPGGRDDRRTDEDGQPITADFLDGFDDIVVAQ